MIQNRVGTKSELTGFILLQEKTIKDAVVAAYKRLYINVESNNIRSASAAVAQNLIALVIGKLSYIFRKSSLGSTFCAITSTIYV